MLRDKIINLLCNPVRQDFYPLKKKKWRSRGGGKKGTTKEERSHPDMVK